MNIWSRTLVVQVLQSAPIEIKERMTSRLQSGYEPCEDGAGPIAITIKEVQFHLVVSCLHAVSVC
jgi:hypothetical protein